MVDGQKTAVAQTEFARDSVFGYSHSYLPDYVAEKTQGKILADSVVKFFLSDIRTDRIEQRLLELNGNKCVVVDGENQSDFDLFAKAILQATSQGKRFLFRSAASLLTSLAQLDRQPTPPEKMGRYRPTDRPGVILVGSHVQKTTQQLNRLLEEDVTGIEVDVVRLRDRPETKAAILEETLAEVERAFESGKTPVVYTSREELSFSDVQQHF